MNDAFFNFFVSVANTSDTEISITVSTPGLVVSGTLIGYATWEADFIGQLTQAHETMAKGLAQGIKEESATLQSDSFHLRNARLYTATEIINVPLWRGRLSEVNGWMIGQSKRVA